MRLPPLASAVAPLAAVAFAAVALAALGSAAAQPLPPRAAHLSRADGLASNTVYAALQDRRGFLWFGTDAGLCRYDGYAFETYVHAPFEPNALSDNLVRALAEGPDGAIWVGTGGGGLNRLDPDTGAVTAFRHDPADPHSLSDDQVGAVYVDRGGTLWAGTWEGVLNRLDAASGRFTHYAPEVSGSDRFIRDIREDAAGTLWVAAFGGLYRYDAARDALVHVGPDAGATYVSALAPTPSGALWVGSVGRGLFEVDPAAGTFTAHPVAPEAAGDWSRNYVQAVARDAEGGVWVGTRAEGLLRFDPAARTFAPVPLAVPGRPPGTEVTALLVDRAGAVWAGYRGLGVFRLQLHALRVRTYAHDPAGPASLSPSLVLSVAGDRRGGVWVGTYAGGLSRLDPVTGRARRYGSGPGPHHLSHRTVWAVREARDGTVWAATTLGINRYDPVRDRFERLGFEAGGPADGLPHHNAYTLHETRDGTMWAGTWGGLARYDAAAGRFVAYRHDPADPASLSRDPVWAIEEDRRGALWVGTAGGLNRLDRRSGRFTRFLHDPADTTSLAHDHVHDLHEGADGTLWVATGGGLSRLDAATGAFRHLTARDGLPSSLVRGLVEDEDGGLWVVTAGGLAHLDPRTGAVRTFGTHDGLPVGSYTHGAAWRAADGTLWLGSDAGVTAFRPDALTHPAAAPPVVLTDLRVAGRPLPEGRHPAAVREVRLAPGDDFVSFEFAALAFTAPEHLRYAYRLEGLEADWTHSGARRQATYAHLAPGTYTFRVRAAGPDGVWSEGGPAVRVRVEPHLWQRVWFQVFAAALLLGGVTGGYRWRLRHLLEVERTRTRIADDLHDDLGSKVSTVALMVEIGSRSPALSEAERHRLAEAAAMARRLVTDIRDTVWAIDAGHDRLESVVARLEHTAHQMLQGIRHDVRVPDPAPDLKVDLQTRRHVLLLAKEALHNAVRHARATHVEVGVEAEAGRLTLVVRDDGVGFDTAAVDAAGAGRGLRLMQERARQIGGELSLESRPGAGTVVRLTVPIR